MQRRLMMMRFGVLAGMIAVHELGHFVAARQFDVGVQEVGIGFGPALLTYPLDGYRLTIRPIPLGGFVSLKSRPSESSAATDAATPGRYLSECAVWQQSIVYGAGVCMNLLASACIGLLMFGLAYRSNAIVTLGDRERRIREHPIRWAGFAALFPILICIVLPWKLFRKICSHTFLRQMLREGNLVPLIRRGFGTAAENKSATATHAAPLSDISALLPSVLITAYFLGVALAAINIIPLQPLDGGHLLNVMLVEQVIPATALVETKFALLMFGCTLLGPMFVAGIIGDLYQIWLLCFTRSSAPRG
ncbi:site-2 protease family protein [Candidatus Uhrbacteria bacterium]|nr:site-2 protease family protein [Candidatus Uhrbacteria bacterium]